MSPNLINKVFTIHGFNSRKKDASISTGYMHHFLSDPSHWQNFLGQNSSFPSSIIALNVNNCNWLPAEQLCDATVQLPNWKSWVSGAPKCLSLISPECSKLAQKSQNLISIYLKRIGKRSKLLLAKKKWIPSSKISKSWTAWRFLLFSWVPQIT